jgi:serine/threonine-protein kinase HSL1 (negative regulator of Swe1 kinase)
VVRSLNTSHCYRPSANIPLAVNFSSSSILSGFDLGPEHGGETAPRSGPPEMQMNWLSRFLHIKPANKTLCFHIGRGKVRQDLVRLLRNWQRFGIRDVTFDRETNMINARVDKNNRKYTSSSCSSLVFSAWRLVDWRFEVEMLEVDHVLRCNAAFFLSLYSSLIISVLTTSFRRSQDQTRLLRNRALCRS